MAMDDVAGSSSMAAAASDPSHGWQTVSYPKRNRKQAQQPPRATAPDLVLQANGKAAAGVFDAVERRSQERHRALQQQLASRAADLDDSRIAAATGAAYSDDEDSDEAAAPRQEGEVKKPKKPKVKKPKVTVAEAAALIDAENLAAHLVEISVTPRRTSLAVEFLSKNQILGGWSGSRFCPFLRDRIWVGFIDGSCWT